MLCVDRVPGALNCDLDLNRDSLSKLDHWVLSRAAHMVSEVHRGLENSDFHIATTALRIFIYSELCDFYLVSFVNFLNLYKDHFVMQYITYLNI